MMTSTFPTTRSNSHTLKYGIRELQHKKEILLNLEAALKKRITEFRQLCLREGELTGHLPADYPLQPREPIPQVRRRITRSNGNISSELHTSSSSGSLVPPPPPTSIPSSSLTSLREGGNQASHQAIFALPNAKILSHPSRPTSTTSASSAATTSSLQNKQALDATITNSKMNHPSTMTTNRMHSSNREIHRINHSCDEVNHLNHQNSNSLNNYNKPTEHTAAIMLQRRQKQLQQQRQQQQQQIMNKHYDQLFTLPDHFKKPFSLLTTNPNFDSDSLGNMRASSTASSSSSSGSAASSTVSAFAAIPCTTTTAISQRYVDTNLHVRSCSETVSNNSVQSVQHPMKTPTLASSQTSFNSNQDQPVILRSHLTQQPMRPPRSAQSAQPSRADPLHDRQRSGNITKGSADSKTNGPSDKPREDSSSAELRNINHGAAKFQPYYEETKPFQMSDFYKYSAKHRQQQTSQDIDFASDKNKPKTTRQLQDEVASMKNPLKMTACDDQILASKRLIEQSGQRFKNATAKAIACNPSLAERLHNIIPNHHGEGY